MITTVIFPRLGLYFNMNRAAITIGDFEIYWYGLIIGIGLILAMIYGIFENRKVGLSSDDLFNMLLISLPVAIICARLYYVIFSWDMYRDNLWNIFDIRGGGLAIYGCVIGVAISVWLYCHKKKLKLGIVLDILAIGLLIGQSIGRWGNFVNGEAFGTTTTLPWSMTVKSDGKIIGELVHPTFLYESLWNAVGIAVLLFYKRIKKFNGELFCGYLVWYGLGRAIIEGLRSDSLYIGVFRVSQLLALGCFLVGICIIFYKRKKERS